MLTTISLTAVDITAFNLKKYNIVCVSNIKTISYMCLGGNDQYF